MKINDNGFIREDKTGRGMPALISPFMLDRLSKLMEEGANEHGERNWELGDNYSSFVNSAFRHLISYMKGEEESDHLAAIIFNIQAIIHMEETGLDDRFNDMPYYDLEDFSDEYTDIEDCVISVQYFSFPPYECDDIEY